MTPGSRFSLFSGFGFFCLGGKGYRYRYQPPPPWHQSPIQPTHNLSPPLGVAAAVASSASAGISLVSPVSLPLS